MPNRQAGYPQNIRGKGNKTQQAWVKRAAERLKSGKVYRNTTREAIWRRNELQYAGKHWEGIDDEIKREHDIITINMSFSTVNTIVPYMTGSEPNFLVLPYGNGATAQNAALQQAFLNRIWRGELDGQEELESAAVDFVILGDGYVKAGYDLVEKRIDNDEVLGEYADVAKLWVQRINPWDLWIDPTSDGLHNARWVAHRLRLTKEEVEAKDWKNTDQITYSRFNKADANEASHREEVYDNTEYAIIIEFYDLIENYMVLFQEEGEVPLAILEDLPALPIVQLPNYRIPNSPYHMGELEQIWDIQQELNKTRTQMINHRARNVQKIFVQKGKLDDDAREALKSPTVNEAVEVDTQGAPIENIIAPMQIPALSADVYNVSELLQNDIFEITGINEYLRGSLPTTRRTATEATIIEGASNVKSQFKLRQVEKAARKLGRIILGFAADIFPKTDFEELQLYLAGREAELVTRTTSPDKLVDEFGAPLQPGDVASVIMSPSPEIWVGDYEVLVEASSTELRNPVIREQKYRGMVADLASLSPVLAQSNVFIDFKKLLTLWFEAAGIDDVEGMFLEPGVAPSPPDPIAGDEITPEAPKGRPDEILAGRPDDIMGAFGPENTGMLGPEEVLLQ